MQFMKPLLLALGVVALSACGATPEQMAAIERTAQQALDEARAATSKADNAHSVASEAAYAASKAQSAADEALSCCNENRNRIDRAFEKQMRK